MQERKVTLPELILFASTRIALGCGIGLLVSRALNNDERKAAGVALTVVGAITTIPLAIHFARQGTSLEPKLGPSAAA
jgi:hypothetical protein